jgi:predicted dehydrogenase
MTLEMASPASAVAQRLTNPRLGFLGVGWIGRHRMAAIVDSGMAQVAAIADTSAAQRDEAARVAPGAALLGTLDELLSADLDGIVIATPSALHADQAIAAAERGIAVFCQKPLARTAAEARRVIDAARQANVLLGVDLSYRYTVGMRRIRDLVRAGALGEVYAVDAVFHNAYGPDKSWCRDPELSGGGCLIDLGTHLVDLALWTLDFPRVTGTTGRLFARGVPVRAGAVAVEDYAEARLDLHTGGVVRLACSWNLPVGRDAVIEIAFYGTGGGAVLRNVNGSFYDFVAEHHRGTARELLSEPPDEWGGRAAVAWARRLAAGEHYDPDVERLVDVAATLDAIYGR